MGTGYSILLWDGWGAGLVMINPRFYVQGVDMYGNARNWFPVEKFGSPGVERGHFEQELLEKHGIDTPHVRVIWT